MIEMVGLPAHTRLAVDFDDAGRLGIRLHVDNTGHRILIDARHGLHWMILQGPEDGTDRHLHLARGFDVFENNHTAVVKDIVDLLTERFILHVLPSDA